MKSNIERFRATHNMYIDSELGPITILELKAKDQFNLENYLTAMEEKVKKLQIEKSPKKSP
jgi:hypothetical protein